MAVPEKTGISALACCLHSCARRRSTEVGRKDGKRASIHLEGSEEELHVSIQREESIIIYQENLEEDLQVSNQKECSVSIHHEGSG